MTALFYVVLAVLNGLGTLYIIRRGKAQTMAALAESDRNKLARDMELRRQFGLMVEDHRLLWITTDQSVQRIGYLEKAAKDV